MKLKEQVWRDCGECGCRKEMVQDESYGCDSCAKPIDDLLNSGNTNSRDYLEVDLFWKDNSRAVNKLQFCSWRCLLRKVRTLRNDHFVTLPYLTYDQDKPAGQMPKDLLELIDWKKVGVAKAVSK